MKRFIAGLLLLSCFVSGCGYTLKHRLREPFSNPKGIFVPVFDNRTDETGAEIVFTNALIRELAAHKEVKLASAQSGAFILRGTVATIKNAPTALSDLDFRGLQGYIRIPTELGVTVSLILELVDPASGRVIWQRTFAGFRRVDAPINRTYTFEAPSAVGLTTQSVVESLYSDVARDIMRDVYDEMVELF